MLFGVFNFKVMEPKFILIYERLDNLDGKLNNGYVYVTEYAIFKEPKDIENYLNYKIKPYIGFRKIACYELKKEINFKRDIIEIVKYKIV